jgi:pimeloyl-ACP methyl ester carboxylesterase
MKSKNLFLISCIISLILIISGCKKELDNVAISSDGVEISFDVQGEGAPGLVFIHGWCNNRTIWSVQVDHFSEKYKVVNIDLPGFGKSGNNRKNWSIKAYANDVATVIDMLNLDQVVVIGFSLGAPIAIETANAALESVIGVVAVEGLHNIGMMYPPPMVEFMDSVMMDLVLNPTMEKMVGGGFFLKNPETSYARVLKMIQGVPTIGWRESLHGYMQWHNEEKFTSLKNYQTPVLAINTNSEPTDEEAIKKYVPSFHARIIPDVGHVIMWDAADKFNNLLEECIQEFIGAEN